MSFNRKAFYGLNFNWYMMDAVESIAMFMSGYGPIPERVFNNEDNYLKTNKFFSSLPTLSNYYYSSDFQMIEVDSQNNFFDEIKAVQRGIYVYDNEEYTDDYNVIAIPRIKLEFSPLSLEIKNLLKPFVFKDIIFSEVKTLDMKKHFASE